MHAVYGGGRHRDPALAHVQKNAGAKQQKPKGDPLRQGKGPDQRLLMEAEKFDDEASDRIKDKVEPDDFTRAMAASSAPVQERKYQEVDCGFVKLNWM